MRGIALSIILLAYAVSPPHTDWDKAAVGWIFVAAVICILIGI